LAESWELVKLSQKEVMETDKREVTQDNVNAFMSSIEVKVAELLYETGNNHLSQSIAPQTP